MRRGIITVAQPHQGTNTTVGKLIGTVVILGGYTGRWLVAFIPPCTHVVLMEEVIAVGSILRLHGGEIISTGNNHWIVLGRGGTPVGEVETDVGIIAHV